MADGEGRTLHCRFGRVVTAFKIVQGADECQFGAEGTSRTGVREYLKLATAALQGMKGERFDVQITIRSADPGGADESDEEAQP